MGGRPSPQSPLSTTSLASEQPAPWRFLRVKRSPSRRPGNPGRGCGCGSFRHQLALPPSSGYVASKANPSRAMAQTHTSLCPHHSCDSHFMLITCSSVPGAHVGKDGFDCRARDTTDISTERNTPPEKGKWLGDADLTVDSRQLTAATRPPGSQVISPHREVSSPGQTRLPRWPQHTAVPTQEGPGHPSLLPVRMLCPRLLLSGKLNQPVNI